VKNTMTGTGTTAAGIDDGTARRWWILAVVCLAQLMDGLDVTIVNIALPSAQRDLGFSVGDRQWIVTAYSLAFGSLLLLSGRISDLAGRRVMFLAGLVAFGAASALGGAAPNFAVLVTARALQGALLVCAGLFGLVYGFSNVQSHPWSATSTWGFLAGGALLLAAFAWWQTRARHPLLPLRVILDRTRGGSDLAIFTGGIGLFGAFLFLNYYMQGILRYSPVMTGLTFLPMVATLVIAGGICTTQLCPRIGAKVPVAAGMVIAAGALAWLARIGPHSSYAASILGPLMVLGIGIGATIAPAMNAGTTGVQPRDAGIASAAVNTAQQIGGSIGIALLNSLAAAALAHSLAAAALAHSLAAAALAHYLIGKDAASHIVQADAAIHSYTVAFWCSSAIFAAGAVICGLILRAGKPEPAVPDAAPSIHV
jgi:MFS family permease